MPTPSEAAAILRRAFGLGGGGAAAAPAPAPWDDPTGDEGDIAALLQQGDAPTVPVTPSPASALRATAAGPRSSLPGYDAMTADDPNYAAWSAVRPAFAAADGPESYGGTVQARNRGIDEALTALDRVPGPTRNSASVALLRRQFGLGPDRGDISQRDLEGARDNELNRIDERARAAEQRTYDTKRLRGKQEGLDAIAAFLDPQQTRVRQQELADKEALATAAPRVTGEYGLKIQSEKTKGEIEQERIKADAAIEAAGLKNHPGGKLAASLMERVAAGAGVLEGLKNLRELKAQTWTGPAAGRMQSLLQQVPLVPSSDKFARFKAETDAMTNTIIRSITGAQMSEHEVPRIKGQIPLVTDKDNVWEQKARALERTTRGLNARIALLNAGVPASQLDQIDLDVLGERFGGDSGGAKSPAKPDLSGFTFTD